jgi:RHS repeat-associated protein
MKTSLVVSIAWVGLMAPFANVSAQQTPGWQLQNAAVLEPTELHLGESASLQENPPPAPPPPSASSNPPPSNQADAITPEISALAAGLGNDVTRIFLWVRNNIRFSHYFGCRKGATLTYYERSGNDADQAALLAATLRAAGQTVRYNAAWCLAGKETWESYFGVEVGLPGSPDAETLIWRSALGAGGITHDHLVSTSDGNPRRWGVTRFWVEVYLSGQWVRYDASYKPLSRSNGAVNVASSSGYVRTNLLNAALGTTGANSVSGLNAGSLNAYLAARAMDLTAAVSALNPNLSAQEAYGQTYFAPLEPVTTGALTATERFPWDTPAGVAYFLSGGSNGAELLPSNYFTTIQLVVSTAQGGNATLNHTFKFAELAGRNLTLEFDGSGAANQAVIRLDDVIVAAESLPVGAGTTCWLRSIITHAGSANPSVMDNQYQRGSRYALIYAMEAGDELLKTRIKRLAALREAGFEESSREVITQGLGVIGLSWFRQTELAAQALFAKSDLMMTRLHRFGRIGQESSFYVDVGQQFLGIYRRQASQPKSDVLNAFRAESMMASAMEHGVLAQSQGGIDGVSTVRITALNNEDATNPITYLATKDNWSAVKALLVGYSTQTLALLEAEMLSTNHTAVHCLLPRNGNVSRGDWDGYGYMEEKNSIDGSTTILMAIGGGLSGGFATVPRDVASTLTLASYQTYYQPSINTLAQSFHSTAGDPVNTASGFLTAASGAGLALGRDALPRGLSFSLDYDGSRRADNSAGVGYGWDFNVNARLSKRSEIESALGAGTALEGARFALGVHVLNELCQNLSDAKAWTTAQLVSQWMVDALVDNAVALQLGNQTHLFHKKPDGSGYFSPAGSSLTYVPAASATSGKDEVRERHGNVYRFNADGALVEVEDPWTKKATLTYHATTKRLTRITDAYGRSFELTWDANNRLDYVTDPQSIPARVLDLTYDAGGHLRTITDPELKCDHFEYDAQHRLTIQKDHDLRIITHNTEFDAEHRVTQQQGLGLNSQLWQFRYAPGVTYVTNPIDAEEEHHFDAKGRPLAMVNALGHQQKAQFDGQNHPTARITPLGRSSSNTYDGHHNLLTATSSSGGPPPAESTTTNFYDAQHRLKTTTDPRNHVITYGYHGDADGISDPDAKHLPTRVYHTVEGVLIEAKTTYNAAGNVETVTDAAGNVTSFEYDALDRLTYTRLPGPGSHYTQVLSYTAAGDPYQVRDARGHVTTFTYNKRREVTGTSTQATSVDNVVQTIDPVVEYDNNRNAFKVINALGRYTTSTFSATGKLLTKRHSALPGVDLVSNTYDDRDLPWTSTNVLGQTTTFTHDEASRLTDADDHLNRNLHTEKDDDGRPLSVRNVLNQTSTTIYLDAQRKSKNINPLLQEWALQTDAAGNLTHRTNARSKTWVHAYDEAGRLKTTTSPENRVSGVTWNTRGLLASATEPSLQSTTLTYDARGRLDEVTGADYALEHAYDANGNLLTLTETTAALGARSVGRTYDEAGRLKTYTNAESETLKYVWDENGNLRFLEYPDTSRVEYQYDERDRLKFVKEAGVTMAEFQWTMANQLKKIIRANGTVRELFYDAANRLERIEERGPDGRLFYYQRCAFDDGDRMTKRLILPAPGAWNEPADTATFDGDNWMTSFNGAALTHDADGNLQAAPTRPAGAASGAADASTSFGWDARNRVMSATTGATARHYTYSPDGNLTHLRTGSATAVAGTRFTVNPHGAGGLSQVLVRTDLATNDKTKVVHGLGVLYEKRPDGSLRWLHYDHLGNTVALTNSSGAVTGRASYSLWGMQHSTSGDVQSTPFLYNGRFGVVTEAASGCLHMRARWYNPRIRRFLSSDPAGFDGGWNMFAYGNGNPLAMVDPFGLGARSSNESGFWTDSYMNDSRQKTAALTAQVNALNEKNASYAAYSRHISNNTDPSADIAKQNWYPVGVSYGQREAYDQAQATKQALWDGAVLAASFTPIGRAEAVVSRTVYSVAFETRLAANLWGRSSTVHKVAANTALNAERSMNPALSQLVPPGIGGSSPTGFIWHHATIDQGRGNAGMMQLVPTSQHHSGSPFSHLFHPLPGGAGGYWEWARPAGAPQR